MASALVAPWAGNGKAGDGEGLLLAGCHKNLAREAISHENIVSVTGIRDGTGPPQHFLKASRNSMKNPRKSKKSQIAHKNRADTQPPGEQTGGETLVIFRDRPLPNPAYLAGYSALMDRYDLHVPLHHEMTAVSPKTLRHRADGWNIVPMGLRPGPSTVEHLIFALKHEGVQLLTLKKVFQVFEASELATAAMAKPTSGYLRRLCHLYEWLLDRKLDVPSVSAGSYVDLIDTDQQYATAENKKVRRFRVSHNLPGIREFCPVVFRTRRIDAFIESDFSRQARQIVESAPRELIARAAAFLLLSDSKASFEIEKEKPPRDRLMRWGSVIGKAGTWHLDRNTLVDLQRQLIGDDRFVRRGLRHEGGFVGRHDAMGQPVPEHISARADDLARLLDGLVAFAQDAKRMQFHAVLAAACIAFGFVYIHPFEDGNGRIHRFLLHHVLADHGFTPEEIVLPISSVILDDIVGYKNVLTGVSGPLLNWIDWTTTPKGNIEVLNQTADFYRYFDATAHCEFLFGCIERAVAKDLPEELGFLEHRDAFHREITAIVDMGERTIDLLLKFLQQGQGTLSKRARTQEFAALREDEVQRIQTIYTSLRLPSSRQGELF